MFHQRHAERCRALGLLSVTNLQATKRCIRVGFLLNPVAGAGGPEALKGSDSEKTREAVALGKIAKRSPSRALQFFTALEEKKRCEFICVQGEMGSFALQSMSGDGIHIETLNLNHTTPTSAEDTIAISRQLLTEDIDILIFVGGDGTARDICSAVGHKVPVLGVPSGVKMHSGVFAITPSSAAKVLDELTRGNIVGLMAREVRDIDEASLQKGVVKSRYFGSMLVPEEIRYIQSVKQGGSEVDELVLADIAAEIKERLCDEDESETLVIFGTGSTTQFMQDELDMPGTLLGVDVYLNNKPVTLDADAATLECLTASHKGRIVLILTAIGGQGHIIGRGNQQLSPQILRRIGRENLWLVLTKTKLKALDTRPLLMDSGDSQLDDSWRGLVPVVTGYRDQVLYRLGIWDGE